MGYEQLPGRESEPMEPETRPEHAEAYRLWEYVRGVIERGEVPDPKTDWDAYREFAEINLKVDEALCEDPAYIEWTTEYVDGVMRDPEVQARLRAGKEGWMAFVRRELSKEKPSIN